MRREAERGKNGRRRDPEARGHLSSLGWKEACEKTMVTPEWDTFFGALAWTEGPYTLIAERGENQCSCEDL